MWEARPRSPGTLCLCSSLVQHWIDDCISELEHVLRRKVVQVHKLHFAQQKRQLALADNPRPVSVLNVDRSSGWSKASDPLILPVGESLTIDGLYHRNDLTQQPWVKSIWVRVQVGAKVIPWQPPVPIGVLNYRYTGAWASLLMINSFTSTVFLIRVIFTFFFLHRVWLCLMPGLL